LHSFFFRRNLSPKTVGHISLATVAIIYGANYIIAKSVMPNPIGPNSFILLRVAGACILFWIIAFRKIQIPIKRDWPRFIFCGICGVATNQLFFFNGLSLTSPINASIIMTSNPLLVMLISAWFLRHKITTTKVIGLVIGAAGALTILLTSKYDASHHSSSLGDAFILINSTSWAFYLVTVKPLFSRYSPMTITAWVFLIGLCIVTPISISDAQTVDWASLSSWQWFAVGYVIVAVTFLTYLLNMIGIHRLSPTLASVYIYFQPLLAGIFAWLFSYFLDEDFTHDITWLKIACGGLIVLGVYLVNKAENKANSVVIRESSN
jgi:drug/metabolite transporter (DMT)-like permease